MINPGQVYCGLYRNNWISTKTARSRYSAAEPDSQTLGRACSSRAASTVTEKADQRQM